MRLMPSTTVKHLFLSACAAVALAACSPEHNWRDYSSQDAPFRAMFPDKPSVHTRTIDVGGLKVAMTMTAAQVKGVTYAVGSAQAPDAAQAQAALASMQTALVRNIGATVKSEKSSASATAAGAASSKSATRDVEASGTQKGVPMRLVGHFAARDKHFYQVIIMGPEKEISKENVEMFMSSFKLQ